MIKQNLIILKFLVPGRRREEERELKFQNLTLFINSIPVHKEIVKCITSENEGLIPGTKGTERKIKGVDDRRHS